MKYKTCFVQTLLLVEISPTKKLQKTIPPRLILFYAVHFERSQLGMMLYVINIVELNIY